MTIKHNENNDIDFAAELKELEDITSWFETSEVDLAQALKKFERGMELATDLKNHLQKVENKVIKIKQRFEDVSVIQEMPASEDEVAANGPELGLF